MGTPSLPVLQLRDAVVLAGGYPVLSGVTLDVRPASLVVVSGANGSGKTSLLRLLAGLLRLSAGSGRVVDVDLRAGDLRALRRRIGWLGHEGSFYDELTVRENLTFAARALERPIGAIVPVASRLGLEGRLDTVTKSLSAGQRRRLGLAWLLVRRPEVWLLDEPYASLDDEGRAFIDELLVELVASGATAIVTAHDRLAGAGARRFITLAGGRVVADES